MSDQICVKCKREEPRYQIERGPTIKGRRREMRDIDAALAVMEDPKADAEALRAAVTDVTRSLRFLLLRVDRLERMERPLP